MALVPNPTPLDFGDVRVGQSPTLQVALTNTGSTQAIVTATIILAPFAAVMVQPCVDSQATENVDVTFSPTRTGSFTETLTIRWTVGGVPQTDVTVSCRGTGT